MLNTNKIKKKEKKKKKKERSKHTQEHLINLLGSPKTRATSTNSLFNIYYDI